MTIQEMINRVNVLMPHQYPDDLLLGWVNELEKDIADVLSRYETEDDTETADTIETVAVPTEESPEEEDTPSGEDTEYDPTNHQSMDEDLQIDEPQIYVPFVIAQICLANEEYDRYNNHTAVFMSKYQDWRDKYIRNHMPRYRGKVMI